jgi:hypothetical protein
MADRLRPARLRSWQSPGTPQPIPESHSGIPTQRSTTLVWGLLTLCGLLAAAPAVRAEEARFSQSLAPADAVATGIQKLTSDQLAVLDALVRQDERIYAVPDPKHPAPARFSQRLLPAERRDAGLGLLTPAELAKVDTAVAQYETRGESATASVASPVAWQPEITVPGLEVHGMISFTYGAGSGGSSMMGGAMAVSVADPEHGFAFTAGYAEMHGKGPLLGRGCYGGYYPDYPYGFGPPLAP